MAGMLFWNYYVTYLSLFMHLVIHTMFLGMWCSYSKLVMFYSFQVVLLHAYSWAIPDRRYASWVKYRRSWFYGLSGLNVAGYLGGLAGGVYIYNYSLNGMVQFTGASIIAYTLLT